MWLFARFIKTNKSLFALTAINILLVYTHYFGWLVVLSEVLIIAYLAREKLKRILLMFAVTALTFAPWIAAIRQAAQTNSGFGQNIGWMSKPNAAAILEFIFNLFEPLYFQRSGDEPASNFIISVPILLIGLTAFALWFVRRNERSDVEKFNFNFLVIFTLAPVSLAFSASWLLPYSVWGTRHLLIVFAPFAILLAQMISKIQIQSLKLASLGTIYFLLTAAFLFRLRTEEPKYIWCAWENLVADLRQTNSNETINVYVFEDLIAYHLWFALRDAGEKFQIIKFDGIEGLTEDKAYFLPRGFDAVKTTESFEGDRFYIAFRAQNWDESKPPLRDLIQKGGIIGKPQVVEAQGLKAFLVEVRKEGNQGNQGSWRN